MGSGQQKARGVAVCSAVRNSGLAARTSALSNIANLMRRTTCVDPNNSCVAGRQATLIAYARCVSSLRWNLWGGSTGKSSSLLRPFETGVDLDQQPTRVSYEIVSAAKQGSSSACLAESR
jgi:hypothetical protein